MTAPILIAVALGWEEAAVCRGALLSSERASGGATLRQARWAELALWILRTGIGPERAHRATRWAIEVVRPGTVVSTGCAAGLLEGVGTGEVIVAEEVIAADGREQRTSREWGECYRRAAARAGLGAHGGRLYTSAEMLFGRAAKLAVAQRTGAIAADMEAAAIADCARLAGIGIGAARVILDPLDLVIPSELPGLVTGSGQPVVARLARAMVRRPRIAAELIRLVAPLRRCRGALAALHQGLRQELIERGGAPFAKPVGVR